MRRDVFQAIADPTRRDIINLMGSQTLTPNAVAEEFDMTRQAISKHIRILSECGLIVIVPKGRERYCTIQPKALEEVGDWLDGFRKRWEASFNRLDKLLDKLQSKKNSKTKSK